MTCCPSVCVAKAISWHAFVCHLGMFSEIELHLFNDSWPKLSVNHGMDKRKSLYHYIFIISQLWLTLPSPLKVTHWVCNPGVASSSLTIGKSLYLLDSIEIASGAQKSNQSKRPLAWWCTIFMAWRQWPSTTLKTLLISDLQFRVNTIFSRNVTSETCSETWLKLDKFKIAKFSKF